MEELQHMIDAPRGVNVRKNCKTSCVLLLFSCLKVLIHEKYDYPIMSLHGISVLDGSDLTITLQPEVLISNSEIRGLKIKQRACLFDNEVQQRYRSFLH